MNYIVEVPDNKKHFVEELLRNLAFVKTRRISKVKAARVNDMLDAIAEIQEIESGKRKPRSMKALLRGL